MSFRHFWLLDLRVKIFKKNKSFSLSLLLCNRDIHSITRARVYTYTYSATASEYIYRIVTEEEEEEVEVVGWDFE
jgi:hypothetical protein